MSSNSAGRVIAPSSPIPIQRVDPGGRFVWDGGMARQHVEAGVSAGGVR